jgi:8-oxo-dGTP pyrophosphatase MutT (NUDIX family)
MLNRLSKWATLFFSQRFLVGTLIILQNDEGKILLLKHRFRKNPWSLPGGLLDHPESTIQCAKRETKEELGLSLLESELELACVLDSKRTALVEIVFFCNRRLAEQEIKEIRLQKREVTDMMWVNLDTAKGLKGILERHRELLLEQFSKVKKAPI